MDALLQPYFHYLKTTLGMIDLVWPEAEADQKNSFQALFFLSKEGAEADLLLLQKMIEALPTPASEIGVLQGSWGDMAESLRSAEILGPVLCFSQEDFGFLKNNFSWLAVYELPGLAQMQKTPDLKREAWKTLKDAFSIDRPVGLKS